MPGKKPKSDYVIQTVVNALHVLEEFRTDGELGVTALSQRLRLHKNNVFRLLATLEQCGYVEQSSENDRYRLGFRCLEIAEGFARGHGLVERARPVLRDVSNQAGETAHLAFLAGLEVVHVDGVVHPQPVLAPSRIGQRRPPHLSALGKVLLAFADEPIRRSYHEAVASGPQLQRRTPSSIVEPMKLLEHLHGVASRGFATDLEECEPGLCCAAAPIHDHTGRVVAALSVSAPAFRLGEDRLVRETAPLVLEATAGLSAQLGYSPPDSPEA